MSTFLFNSSFFYQSVRRSMSTSAQGKSITRPFLMQYQHRLHSTTATNVQAKDLYTQMLEEANEIKDYNYRTYFVRRVKQDMDSGNPQETSELEERLKQLKRIKAVQNLYFQEESIIEKNKA